MSIQWTFIAGFLYFEIGVLILMLLPIFSPRRWHQFFKSRLFVTIREYAAWYFYAFLGVLFLFLMDAIREMRKYSHSNDPVHVHLSTEMKEHVKLFRAQRNFYITSFAILLYFVIRRLITMLIIQSELELKAEKIIKQAEDTVNQAKTTILKNTLQSNDSQNISELKSLLEATEKLLQEEKSNVKNLEGEATKWRLKYEELVNTTSGKGDE